VCSNYLALAVSRFSTNVSARPLVWHSVCYQVFLISYPFVHMFELNVVKGFHLLFVYLVLLERKFKRLLKHCRCS